MANFYHNIDKKLSLIVRLLERMTPSIKLAFNTKPIWSVEIQKNFQFKECNFCVRNASIEGKSTITIQRVLSG